MTFTVGKNIIVPKHSKVNDSETKTILATYNIAKKELPKILKSDPAIEHLDLRVGNIIKIERPSKTAGTAIYYRVIIDG